MLHYSLHILELILFYVVIDFYVPDSFFIHYVELISFEFSPLSLFRFMYEHSCICSKY